MKKRIIVLSTVIAALGLTAFGFINSTNVVTAEETTAIKEKITPETALEGPVKENNRPDFRYDVSSRYLMTITKEKLQHAKSITDILPQDWTDFIVSYKEISINFIENNEQSEYKASGNTELLNAAQLKLLQAAEYSTNVLIRADYLEKHKESGNLIDNYITPHLTIIPAKQAEYDKGKNALLKYLKENSGEIISTVKKQKLQPGRLNFTVSKNGTISEVELESSSGYPAIDKTMTDLINNMPGKWEPAENAKGEKVDQKLVFFYGVMGC